MVVELISVGTELLLGNIVNTNARYLSEKCAMLGLSVYYQTTVGDNRERMAGVIKTALDRADMIILNGGLGPTEDDITKEVCAEVMGARLVEDPTVKAHLEEWYKLRMKSELPESNWGQALVPEGALFLKTTMVRLRVLQWRKTEKLQSCFQALRAKCIPCLKSRSALIFRENSPVSSDPR